MRGTSPRRSSKTRRADLAERKFRAFLCAKLSVSCIRQARLGVARCGHSPPRTINGALRLVTHYGKLSRRGFLALTANAAGLSAAPQIARADTYPTRPVRLIVGFAPGQAIDIVTRIVAQALGERLGEQFIVENRPGAGGNIGTEAVLRAPPDGYTLLAIGSNNMINATLYDNLSYDFIRDIAPVGSVYRVPQVMEVNPSFPARTVPEFIAYANANPGKINFASAGSGSVAHVTGELFKMMTGIHMLHVPYRGAAPALTDLIAGEVHVMFDNLASSIAHIRAAGLPRLG